MIDENQGQYLSFKNHPNTFTTTYRSQVVYTNRNVYNTNQNIQPNTGQTKPSPLSKQNHIIAPKSKEFQHPISKSPRSNCQVISFSTDFTNKNQCPGTPKKQVPQTNQMIMNQNLHEQYSKGRLTKTKSQIEIFKPWQKAKKEQSLCKKIMQDVIEQVPSRYQADFKTYQDRHDNEKYSSLIETIKVYEQKIERLQKEIMIKNAKIKSLEKEKLHPQSLNYDNQIQSYLRPENRYFNEENKQNVRRLLNMLQQTDEYKEFARFALDDNGIVLLSEASKTKKAKIDAQNTQKSKKSTKLHYCSCNKQLIPQQYLWVPESIYEYGRQFLKTHQDQSNRANGFMSKSEYELLLYELNKMWRQREKRIVNTISHEKNLQIDKLKRKYNLHGDRLNSARKNQF